MTWLNRQVLTVLAAVALPIIMAAAFAFYTSVNNDRLEHERISRERSEQISALLDVTLQGDLRLARSLASATSMRHDDIQAAYVRAQEFRAISPMWRTVRLSSVPSSAELFDLRRSVDAPPRKLDRSVQAVIAGGAKDATIGGIVPDRDGGYGISLHVPVRRGAALRYVLTIVLDPDAIQQLVNTRFPTQSVGAVVDRSGHFIARSVDYEHRQGQPGSRFLRAALGGPPHGSYRGVTLEGLRNYTSYAFVPLTGWSTHIAIDATLIDGPRQWSAAVWGLLVALCGGLWAALVLSSLRDHAQRRVQDERARQAQKMEAVGHLTGGIAHDFNNLLTAVIGGLDLALRRSEPSDASRRYIEGALDAARRGVALTSRLLAFSRVQKLQSVPVELDALIAGMGPLLEQSLGPSVALQIAISPRARTVKTDANQLELALLNVALNARDAMPHGGEFRIASEAAPPRSSRAGNWVRLSLSDTGVGMSREVAQRAMEPFFTTKGVDRGTGLGLSQVYALARQAGGEVSIESTLGRGTTIQIELPAGKPDLRDATTNDQEDRRVAAPGAVKILVVDDDEAVRQITTESLRAGGYSVTEAANGDAALAALAGGAPDLLLTDFLMPGLNGAEVAARARRLHPTLKILIVSGHMDSAAISKLIPDVPILRKPFETAELWRKVDNLLNQKAN